jgi:hypothetical protein
MTKGERRKARKAARAAGMPLTGELAMWIQQDFDRGDEDQTIPETYGPERLANGKPNIRRAKALDRWARMVYNEEIREP